MIQHNRKYSVTGSNYMELEKLVLRLIYFKSLDIYCHKNSNLLACISSLSFAEPHILKDTQYQNDV